MRVDPYTAVFISTSFAVILILFTSSIYYLLKSRRVRETPVYLSGEPENVVSMITPSIASLYWGFMMRFAKSLYEALVKKVHTGSLHDWYRFISSWLGILLMLLIVIYIIYTVTGW